MHTHAALTVQRGVQKILAGISGKDGPWEKQYGNFSPDGHVSIDMGIQTRCGSLRVGVEADGAWS